MAVRILLASLLLVAAASAADGPPAEDPKKEPAFIRAVNESIGKGLKWLLEKQSATGQFPAFEDTRGSFYDLGMHALVTLAIVKSGQPLDSIEVLKALKTMHSLYELHRTKLYTYEAGLTLMVLDAKYFTEPPDAKRGARRRKVRIDPADLEWAKQLALWLQTQQRPGGLWRYPQNGEDMSNTQYAALGLWSAHRLGVELNKSVVRRLMDATLERQQPPDRRVPFILDPTLHRRTGERRSTSMIHARGWRYMPFEMVPVGEDGAMEERRYPYSGSMTTAGIAVLAIGRDILGADDSWLTAAKDRQVRQAMWEGLAWLQANWNLEDNPGQPGNWPFYWIYGLERCARLAGVEYIGYRDWYFDGARRLMADQRPEGSWPKHPRMRPPGGQNMRWWSDQVDTAFALLFLTKSTPEIRTPVPTITADGD